MFKRNPENDAHERVGDSVVLDEIAAERGWTKADLKYELDVRADVLRYIAASALDDYLTVSAVIRRFERDREGLLARVYAETSLVSVDENGEADESDDPVAGENDAAADDFDDEIEVSPETERLLADLFDIELDDDADGDSDDDADDDEVADAAEAEAAPAADESEAATPDAADESDDPDDVGTDWEVVGDDADAGADDAEADSAVAADASDASPDDPDDADETVTDDDREADDAR